MDNSNIKVNRPLSPILVGGGGTGTVSSRTLQENPYSLDIDGNYDVYCLDTNATKTINLYNIDGTNTGGVKVFQPDENYSTLFFGTGSVPDVPINTGDFIYTVLGMVSSDSYVFYNKDYVYYSLSIDDCTIFTVTNKNTNTKAMYVVVYVAASMKAGKEYFLDFCKNNNLTILSSDESGVYEYTLSSLMNITNNPVSYSYLLNQQEESTFDSDGLYTEDNYSRYTTIFLNEYIGQDAIDNAIADKRNFLGQMYDLMQDDSNWGNFNATFGYTFEPK